MHKVCIISTVHEPLDNRIYYKQALSLDSAGYDITIIARGLGKKLINRVNFIPLSAAKNRLMRMVLVTIEAYRKALNVDAGVYHIHDPELLIVAKLLTIQGKTVIYDMHENVPKSILTKPWINPLFRKIISRLYESIEKYLLAGIPTVFAEESYSKYYRYLNKTVTVLNYPIAELNNIMHTSKNNDISIGYIGSITPERGSLLMLEVIQILLRRGLSVKLQLVGSVGENHKQELLKYIELNNLDNVNIHGFLPSTEGLEIISKCHVGLALLMPCPNYYESLPTKLFEYMLLGLPVVTSNFPLYESIINHNECGICVDPNEPLLVADAVEHLLKNPEIANRMGANGTTAVLEKYNWNSEANKLLGFYEELLNHKDH